MTVASFEPSEECGFSENTLLGGRVRLRQPKRGYRVAIDPVLLAAAVPAGEGDHVLDVGTGTGAAALCLAARVPGCRITGLELQPLLARIAEGNASLNRASACFDVLEGDLRSAPCGLARDFGHVMANPPYLERGAGSRAREPDKASANMEGEAELAEWVGFCARMVRRRGTVTLIHRADRLDALLAAFRGQDLGGTVVFPLWPRREGRDARRVIVAARKGSKAPLRLAPGLVLHREDGGFTAEAEAVLRNAAGLSF